MMDLSLKGTSPPRYSKGALGGTFDLLHIGHRRFIRLATEMCDELLIGVTSDDFVNRTKVHDVEPFEKRVRNIKSFIELLGASDGTRIVGIDDPFGPAVSDEKLEALFVTVDTIDNGVKINDERRSRKLPPIDIIVIPRAIAEGGGFVSSSRIRVGEIDVEGKLISTKTSDS